MLRRGDRTCYKPPRVYRGTEIIVISTGEYMDMGNRRVDVGWNNRRNVKRKHSAAAYIITAYHVCARDHVNGAQHPLLASSLHCDRLHHHSPAR